MRRDGAVRAAGLGVGAISAGMVILGLAGLAVWSVAGFWSFPNALPDAISSRSWMRFRPEPDLHPLNHTFVIAGAATGIALILTIACLEAEHRHALTPASRSLWILYLPLLVPQVAFLPGLQAITLLLGGGTHLGMVVLGHLVFVLPYVFLSLAGPWRQWDARFDTVGAALGVTPNARFWRDPDADDGRAGSDRTGGWIGGVGGAIPAHAADRGRTYPDDHDRGGRAGLGRRSTRDWRNRFGANGSRDGGLCRRAAFATDAVAQSTGDEGMTMRGLELRDLQITINGAPLVSVNTTVAPGQVVTIMGPSGVGKSTILGGDHRIIGARVPLLPVR